MTIKPIKLFLFLLLISIVIIIFPKRSRFSAIVGQQFLTCKCIGIEKNYSVGDAKESICYGLPISCTEKIGF